MPESLHVVAVVGDADRREAVARNLERAADRVTVTTTAQPAVALTEVRAGSADCVVSDDELSETDGLAFFDDVQDVDERLPFVLLIGGDDETLASRALSRGVTEYVRKSGASEQWTILANRVERAVDSHRTREMLERERERYRTFLEQSTDLIAVVDQTGAFEYVSRAWSRHMDYETSTLEGRNAFEFIHDEDADQVWQEFAAAVDNPDETYTAVCRFRHADGSWRWLEIVGNNQFHNPRIEGLIVNVRDVTGRKNRERQLRRQNERLEQFASVVSHDLRNPLNVISGRLDLAAETGADEHFDVARDTLEDMEAMIDDLLELAREGQFVEATDPVSLPDLFDRCRETVDAAAVSLSVDTDATVLADRTRLRRLVENLLRNAVEHGSTGNQNSTSSDDAVEHGSTSNRTSSDDAVEQADADVSVTVGDLPDQSGFYVADDGPGIPPADRDSVLEVGYTTAADGTGLGLPIVQRIVEAHGWSLSLTEAADGGARFEITGVETGAPSPELCRGT